MPDFIIIGAAKSGTTSLAQYLGQHSEVCISKLKEARYLAYPEGPPDYRGYGPRGDEIMRIYRETMPRSMAEYEALFDQALPSQLTGEASPAYLYLEGTAARISELYPDTKVIAILRNPVERAYSSYLHMRREDAEDVSFREALNLEPSRIAEGAGLPYHYASMGFYARQLAPYFEAFDSSRIAVFFYEDFASRTAEVLAAICRFLDIDDSAAFDSSERRNVSGIPVNRSAFNAFNRLKGSLLPKSFKRILPGSLRSGLNKAASKRLLRKPSIGEEEANRLCELYRKEKQELADLLGVNPPWRID
ncbi:sulfotransferase family protein [Haloferula rosea]|uniref:Sulfotransferase n=1 Tax=Haloferula rosea TaxID=490093 RepID=A0A934VGQ1_9BACT|nr:sulfotransferase [Haloferula rosea]MBK1827810.1 sulfotransferase [Haloferula rosea]